MKTKYIKLITVIVLQMFLLSNVIASEARQSHLRKKGTAKVSDRDLIGGKFANLKGVKWLEGLEMEGVDIKVLAPEKDKILTTEDFRRFLLDNKKLVDEGEQLAAQAKDNSLTEDELREKIDKLLGKFLLKAEVGSKIINIIFSLSDDKIQLGRGSGQKEGSLEASRSGASLSKKIVSGKVIFTILLEIYLHELRTVWLKERESIWENLLAVGITEYIDFDSGIVGSYSKADDSTIIEVVVGNLEPALDPAELGLTTEVTEVGANAMTIEVKKDGRIYISKEFNLTPQEIQYKGNSYKGGETKRIWEENTELINAENLKGVRCPLTKKQILTIDKLMRAAGERVDYDILWEIGKTGEINNDSYTLHILQADPLVPLGKYQPIPADIEPIAESYISQGNIKVDNGVVVLVEETAKISDIEAVCKELSEKGFEVIKVQRNAGCLELGNRKAGLEHISVLLDPSAPSKWVHTQVNFRDFVKKQGRPMALIGGRAFQAGLRKLDYYKAKEGIYISKETVGVIANDRKAVMSTNTTALSFPRKRESIAINLVDSRFRGNDNGQEPMLPIDKAPSELDELFRGEERRGLLEIDAGDSIAMDRVIEYALEFLVKYAGIENLHPEIKELISDVIASPSARNDAQELLNTIKHNPEAANQLLLFKNALHRIDKLHSIPLYPTYSQSNVVKVLLYKLAPNFLNPPQSPFFKGGSLRSLPKNPFKSSKPQRKMLTKENIKILLTHIDLDTLKTYQLELKNKEYNNIFIAANAKDAIKIIKKEKPDLLIQDINISSSQNILEEYAGIKKDKAVVIAWSGGWYSLEKIRIDWQKIDSKIEVSKFFYLGGIFSRFETVVGKCLKTQFNTIAPEAEIEEFEQKPRTVDPPQRKILAKESMKILITHLYPPMLEECQTFLEHNGYKILIATSSEEAIEIIRREKPDLLIEDVFFHDGEKILNEYAAIKNNEAIVMAWTASDYALEQIRTDWQKINSKIQVYELFKITSEEISFSPLKDLLEEGLKTQFNTIEPAEEIEEARVKILFVHNNKYLLKDMPKIFPEEYQIFTADSMPKAVDIIQRVKPDLLVQDVKFSDAGLIIEEYALSREDRADIIAWTFGTYTLNMVRRHWQRIDNKINVHRVAVIPIRGLFEEPEMAYQSLIRTIEWTITHEIQSAQKADSLLNKPIKELDSSL